MRTTMKHLAVAQHDTAESQHEAAAHHHEQGAPLLLSKQPIRQRRTRIGIKRHYLCPLCVRIELLPEWRMKWYDYFLLPLLLRPLRCPHCFNKFIRGIL